MENFALFFYLLGCLASFVLIIPEWSKLLKEKPNWVRCMLRGLLSLVDIALSWANVFLIAASRAYGFN